MWHNRTGHYSSGFRIWFIYRRLGVHYGAEKLGATVVPMSSGNTLRQIQILKDFQISALCCTPSYALYLSETAKENQIDWSQTAFRLGIFGAEPWSEEMRIEIEKTSHSSL